MFVLVIDKTREVRITGSIIIKGKRESHFKEGLDALDEFSVVIDVGAFGDFDIEE